MITPDNVPLGLYVPGTTVAHRLPAGTKLIVLLLYIVGATVAIRSPEPRTGTLVGVVALSLALAGYGLARIPWPIARGQLISPMPLIIAFGVLLWWRTDLYTACANVLSIYSAVVAATLLTLTTKVSAMMDAIEHGLSPLERIGVPVPTISLAFSLTIRLIPLMLMMATEVRDAQKARGLTGARIALTSFGVPLIVKALVRTRALGEAMISRGIGED